MPIVQKAATTSPTNYHKAAKKAQCCKILPKNTLLAKNESSEHKMKVQIHNPLLQTLERTAHNAQVSTLHLV